MKTILMKTRAAGPDGVMVPDHRYTVNDDLAAALIGGGFAEEVGSPPVETQNLATRNPAETADKPKAKPTPRKRAAAPKSKTAPSTKEKPDAKK